MKLELRAASLAMTSLTSFSGRCVYSSSLISTPNFSFTADCTSTKPIESTPQIRHRHLRRHVLCRRHLREKPAQLGVARSSRVTYLLIQAFR